LRNVIDHRELPVAEKEAREFTAVTSSTQSQLSIVDKARIDSLPSVSHKAVAIFPSVATKRKLTNAIINNTSIRTAVSAWCDDEASATTTYGHISTWDTSVVTDMSYLFGATYDDNYNNYVGNGAYCSSISTFNSDISTWNGKCRCCLFIAHDESKLFYCRLTYMCRCVVCFVLVASSNHHHYYDHVDDHHYHHRSVERNDYVLYVLWRIVVQSAPINLGW